MRARFGTWIAAVGVLSAPMTATAAPRVRIALDAGAHAEALGPRIAAEVADVVWTSSSAADLVVRLSEEDELYRVQIADREAPLAEREVPRSDGLPSALRAAALLTADAVETIRALDDPLELPPPPAPFSVVAHGAVVSAFWARPATPQLGFSLGAGLDFHAFSVGLSAAWIGEPCCRRDTTGIRGGARELVFLVEGAWTFVTWGPVYGRVRAAGGVDWVVADAESLAYADKAPPQRVEVVEGAVRGGLALDVEVLRDRLWFGLAAGAWWRLGPLEISVPPGYEGEGWLSGRVVPWLELRLEARLF